MRSFYAFAILLLACQSFTFSQTVLIRGQVKTGNDSVQAGVSVIVKGTHRSFITDRNGEFIITSLRLPAVLIFTFVGHKSQIFALKKTDTSKYISIKLTPIETELNEVVVVGYGTRKKKVVTGSVATVRVAGTGTAGSEGHRDASSTPPHKGDIKAVHTTFHWQTNSSPSRNAGFPL